MKTKKYDLICMSFDGDYVKNSSHNSIEDAENTSSDLGSKWFFYPFSFILSGQKIVSSYEGLIRMSDKKSFGELMFKNRKLKTVINTFKKTYDYLNDNDLTADCEEFEHIMIETNKNLIKS